MYTEVQVEPRQGSRKLFICIMSSKSVCPSVDTVNQDKDTQKYHYLEIHATYFIYRAFHTYHLPLVLSDLTKLGGWGESIYGVVKIQYFVYEV